MKNDVRLAGRVLHVVAYGAQDAAEARATTDRCLALVAEAGLSTAVCLIDIRDSATLDADARRIYAEVPGMALVLRLAYLTDSVLQVLGVEMVIRLGGFGHKARAFRDESRALAWLARAQPDVAPAT